MKRGIGFFILAVLILLFSISCDFKNEDNNLEENNSNEEIMNDGNQDEEDENEDLNNDIGKVNPDDKYEKVSEEERSLILKLHNEGDLIFGARTIACYPHVGFDRWVDDYKSSNKQLYSNPSIYLIEFSEENIYYVAGYHENGVNLMYYTSPIIDSLDIIKISNLDEVPDMYNNKDFSFVLEVREVTFKTNLITEKEDNFKTKIYLPLSLKNSTNEVYPKYLHYSLNNIDWSSDYIILNYRDLENSKYTTANYLIPNIMEYFSRIAYELYEFDGVKYIRFKKFGITDVKELLGSSFYWIYEYGDLFIEKFCDDEKNKEFENFEEYLYLKYDDFIDILFTALNS